MHVMIYRFISSPLNYLPKVLYHIIKSFFIPCKQKKKTKTTTKTILAFQSTKPFNNFYWCAIFFLIAIYNAGCQMLIPKWLNFLYISSKDIAPKTKWIKHLNVHGIHLKARSCTVLDCKTGSQLIASEFIKLAFALFTSISTTVFLQTGCGYSFSRKPPTWQPNQLSTSAKCNVTVVSAVLVNYAMLSYASFVKVWDTFIEKDGDWWILSSI